MIPFTATMLKSRGKPHVVHLPDIAPLPTRWYGYEGVNALVLSTSKPEIYGSLSATSGEGSSDPPCSGCAGRSGSSRS